MVLKNHFFWAILPLFFQFTLQESPVLQLEYSDLFKIARTLPWIRKMNSEKMMKLITPILTGNYHDGIEGNVALRKAFFNSLDGLEEEAALGMEKFVKSALKNVSEPCQRHMTMYIQNIFSGNTSQHSPFYKMWDYTRKFINAGYFESSLIKPGHYDECIKIQHPEFYGQHCSISERPLQKQYVKEYLASFGLCLPSSCTEMDLRSVFEGKVFTSGPLSVPDDACRSSLPKPMESKTYCAMIILVVFLALGFGSTWADFYFKYDKTGWFGDLSWRKTVGELIAVVDEHQESKLDIFKGLSVLWLTPTVVWAHLVILNTGRNLLRAKEYGKMTSTFGPFEIMNVPLDKFFLISGINCALRTGAEMKKGHSVIARSFFKRCFRLNIVLAFLFFVIVPLVSFITGGPLPHQNLNIFTTGCDGIHWRFLTFTSSFFDSSKCQPHLWHLSTEMQLTVIGTIAVILAPKFPLLMTCISLPSIAITLFGVSFITYIYDLDPSPVAGSLDRYLWFGKWWTHVPEFFSGIILAKYLAKILENKLTLSKKKAQAGWLVVLFLIGLGMWITVNTIAVSNDGIRRYTRFDSALFVFVEKLLNIIVFSWLYFAHFNGHSGFLGRLLTWRWLRLFSKVQLTFFLFHMVYQTVRISWQYAPYEPDYFALGRNMVCDTIYFYLISCVIHVIVTAPLQNTATRVFDVLWPIHHSTETKLKSS